MRFLFFLVFLSASIAEARVFSYDTNWVSAYVRGTGGLSSVGDDAFADSSGDDTKFNREAEYNLSGEIGVSFLLGKSASFRIGVENVQARAVQSTGKEGTTKYMDVESNLNIWMPTANVEVVFSHGPLSRAYGFGGVGYGMVKLTNDYQVTAAGQAQYTGAPSSYKEALEGNAIAYQAGVGFETFLFDNVAIQFEGGYRYLPISDLKYRSDVTAIRGGGSQTFEEGKKFKNNDGKDIELDMSGPFVGIAFKFYIPPLK